MGWDAWLEVVGQTERYTLDGCEWNYTYNTNPMVATALERAETWAGPPTFWAWLNGQTAEFGKVGLQVLVAELERDPDRYRALNPPNGYGDYDGLVEVLRAMAAAAGDVEGRGVMWRLSL